MTLIIAAANSENAILVCDRRLTLSGGRVLDEETCKLTVFACNDAKVMIAYTGSAMIGDGSTGDWIIDTLSRASNGTPSIYEVIESFKNIANSELPQIRLANSEFRLELIAVGFYFSENKAHPKIWKISNLGDDSKFIVTHGSNEVMAIEFGGSMGGVTEVDKREIKELLLKNKPAHGIEMKLVNVVKNASNSPKSCNTVGKQINSCYLSSALNSPFIATYHSNIAQNLMYSVNSVLAIAGGGASVMKDGVLTAGNECPPVSLPIATPSQRCPCGSGLKYKHCHSRIKYPYLPLCHGNTLTVGSLDSGNQ